MSYKELLLETHGPVATITLNRPEALNAVTWCLLEEIEDALKEISRNDDIKVTVITGAGRAFCAGIDINEVKDDDMLASRAIGRRIHETDRAVRMMAKPVIAKVRGACLGAGLELAISCDMIMSTEDASYGLPHMHIGIPSIVEAAILPQAIGIQRTREMCFTAEFWDGRKAERLGLVNHALPEDELDAAVDRLTNRLSGFSPLAMAVQKEIINKWMDTDLQSAIDFSINSVAINFSSEDQKEGMAAFVEKRPPVFTGR
jgi:enoyl-CoA hydratase/carnithine racemase